MSFPAIFDSDVGTDPDDTVVLIMLARHPEVFRPALLVTNDETPSLAKARFAAQIVEAAGGSVAVAAGLPSARGRTVDRAERSGLVEGREVDRDGVDRIIEVLDAHPVVDYFGLGALTNLAVALDRHPELAARVRLHQMGPAVFGAHPRSNPQYNARIDPGAFRRAVEQVPRPSLLTSHTSWCLHPQGRPELGMFPDDPLGQLLATSPRRDLSLLWRHLEAFLSDGSKSCSIMHDPLTVLAAHDPDMVDRIELEVVLDDHGWIHLSPAAREVLAALPGERTAAIGAAIAAPPAPDGATVSVRLGLAADHDRARRAMLSHLLAPDDEPGALADRWRDHGRASPLRGPA